MRDKILEHISVMETLLEIQDDVNSVIKTVIKCISSGGTILTAGNGGSAADAQHFAGELVGRYTRNRRAIPCICLSSDSSVVTCIGNDFGYDSIFARQVDAFKGSTNLLFLISTSGCSQNLIQAANTAKEVGLKSVALLGKGGGDLADLVDEAIIVDSSSTARIQECHIFLIHLICDAVEELYNA